MWFMMYVKGLFIDKKMKEDKSTKEESWKR